MKRYKKLSLLEKIMNIAAWITAIGSILFAILGFVLFCFGMPLLWSIMSGMP